MSNGFRVQSIIVEGFKGFTTSQEIDFKGRHVFLLGQNNNGKSSIIEAVRWGLFGSRYRPGEIVANSGYSDSCRVALTLTRDGKQWKLLRNLIRGVSGRSVPTLYDDNGKEQQIGDVIPLLDSVDAGEGTHVIFSSPQSAPLRHQPDDLSPFHRTVLNHVGLLRPQSFHTHINTFLTEQEVVENNLSEKLTNVERKIDDDIAFWERRRGGYLSSPPWGNQRQPTIGQSENKTRTLIQEISGNSPDKSLDGASLSALIENAKDALEKRRQQTQFELQKEVETIAGRRSRLEVLRDSISKIEAQQSEIESVQSQLESVLVGNSFDDLYKIVEETRSAVDVTGLRQRIVDGAILLLSREHSDDLPCPVCATEHSRADLQTTLLEISEELSIDEASSQLSELEEQLRKSETLKRQLKTLAEGLDELVQASGNAFEAIDENDKKELSGQVNLDNLSATIKQCQAREDSLEEQIEGKQDELDAIQTRLSKLEEEERFHDIQRRLQSLNLTRERFGRIENAYQDLVSFGETVRKIRQVVEGCFDQRLKEEIPVVSEELSQVFAALTRHPYFDKLTIEDTSAQKLELRVASSQDASGRTHPSGVLNGQAESALELVPYFTFSQLDDATTEVYLVMLDDPTRAFDEEHIEILIEQLAELGKYVQIVVASQETAKFQKFLPYHFKQDTYVVVETTNWSYQNGPRLSIEYK